eukprot:scpid18571/ scgid3119/ Band 4.1-like protein 1; Neuronal protein 4.1
MGCCAVCARRTTTSYGPTSGDAVKWNQGSSSATAANAGESWREKNQPVLIAANTSTELLSEDVKRSSMRSNFSMDPGLTAIASAERRASDEMDGGRTPRKRKSRRRDDRIVVRVLLLDDTSQTFKVTRKMHGQELFDLVCENVNLWERDYFGLRYQDSQEQLYWLELNERIMKQIKVSPNPVCYLCVKYYIQEPTTLTEEITRYQYFLQLKRDILYGRILVSHDTAVHLFACAVQSELGDYNEEEFEDGYVSEFLFLPEEYQTPELEQEVAEYHRQLAGMVPSQAETAFLERAHLLPLYGVDLHPVKGLAGTDLQVAVGHSGLAIFQDATRVGFYQWPKIKKIQFKRIYFTLQITVGDAKFDSMDVLRYKFLAPSDAACKELWKCCVEQHCFFRRYAIAPEKSVVTTSGGLLRNKNTSSMIHVPRTNHQVKQQNMAHKRAEPTFERAPSRRSHCSLPPELEFPRSSHRWPRGKSDENGGADAPLSPRESALRPIRRGSNKWTNFTAFRKSVHGGKSKSPSSDSFDSKPVSRARSMPLSPDHWADKKQDDSSENELAKRQEMEQLRQTARTPIRRSAWSSEEEVPTPIGISGHSSAMDVRHNERFSPAGASSGTPTPMTAGTQSGAGKRPSGTSLHSRQDSASSFYRLMRRQSRVGAINPAVPATPQSDLSLSTSPGCPKWPWFTSGIHGEALALAESSTTTYKPSSASASPFTHANFSASPPADTDEQHARRMTEMWHDLEQVGGEVPMDLMLRPTGSQLESARRYGVHSMFLEMTQTGVGLGESGDRHRDMLPEKTLNTQDLDIDIPTQMPGQISPHPSPLFSQRRSTNPNMTNTPQSLRNRRTTVCVGLPMVTSSSNQSVDSGHPSSPVSPQITPLNSQGSTLSAGSVPPQSTSTGATTAVTANSTADLPPDQTRVSSHLTSTKEHNAVHEKAALTSDSAHQISHNASRTGHDTRALRDPHATARLVEDPRHINAELSQTKSSTAEQGNGKQQKQKQHADYSNINGYGAANASPSTANEPPEKLPIPHSPAAMATDKDESTSRPVPSRPRKQTETQIGNGAVPRATKSLPQSHASNTPISRHRQIPNSTLATRNDDQAAAAKSSNAPSYPPRTTSKNSRPLTVENEQRPEARKRAMARAACNPETSNDRPVVASTETSASATAAPTATIVVSERQVVSETQPPVISPRSSSLAPSRRSSSVSNIHAHATQGSISSVGSSSTSSRSKQSLTVHDGGTTSQRLTNSARSASIGNALHTTTTATAAAPVATRDHTSVTSSHAVTPVAPPRSSSIHKRKLNTATALPSPVKRSLSSPRILAISDTDAVQLTGSSQTVSPSSVFLGRQTSNSSGGGGDDFFSDVLTSLDKQGAGFGQFLRQDSKSSVLSSVSSRSNHAVGHEWFQTDLVESS